MKKDTTVVMIELSDAQLSSLSNQVQRKQAVDLISEKTKEMADKKIAREQKLYRLPSTLLSDLRKVQFYHSEKQNRRVTETEIVEMALQAFINADDRMR